MTESQKRLNNVIETSPLVAAELLTTATCILNCAYCYIPKSEQMKRMHANVIEQIKSGEYFDVLEAVYGDSLEYLGFWGTEPLLTLSLIAEKLPEILKRFPKIKEIGFSTSLMLDPNTIVNFADALIHQDKPIVLKVQISLDGPPWITDVNRKGGAADTIGKNFIELIKGLNKLDLGKVKVDIRWKATHGIDNMKAFIEDNNKVKEYDDYFKGLYIIFDMLNKNKYITIGKGSHSPTLVVPGKYTSEDGKIFAQYVKLVHSVGLSTTYTSRLLRLFEHQIDLPKRRQFSCSGGDSNLGIERFIHLCHRTFYLNDEGYVESILENKSGIGEADNWDISLFRQGTIDFIKKWYIVDPYKKNDVARFNYVMRGYHDFWKFQMGYSNAMLMELALAGQIDRIYFENKDKRELFALFLYSALSCPMENLLNTGSIHLQVISLMRLFGNGAFEEIYKDAVKIMLEKKQKGEKK